MIKRLVKPIQQYYFNKIYVLVFSYSYSSLDESTIWSYIQITFVGYKRDDIDVGNIFGPCLCLAADYIICLTADEIKYTVDLLKRSFKNIFDHSANLKSNRHALPLWPLVTSDPKSAFPIGQQICGVNWHNRVLRHKYCTHVQCIVGALCKTNRTKEKVMGTQTKAQSLMRARIVWNRAGTLICFIFPSYNIWDIFRRVNRDTVAFR